MKIILTNKLTRNSLTEGRTFQMGFGFAKKLSNNTYVVVSPISACKDYLNDVVYTENTGDKMKPIYGFNYGVKKNIFDKNAYLCFSILFFKNKNLELSQSSSYNENIFKKDIENLDKNYKNIQKMINNIENKLNIEEKSIFYKIDSNLYLAKMSLYWVKSTHLISLYTLLLRAFQYTDKYVEPLEFLSKYPYNLESSLVSIVLPKLKKIINDGYKQQDFTQFNPIMSSTIHNCGICAYD